MAQWLLRGCWHLLARWSTLNYTVVLPWCGRSWIAVSSLVSCCLAYLLGPGSKGACCGVPLLLENFKKQKPQKKVPSCSPFEIYCFWRAAGVSLCNWFSWLHGPGESSCISCDAVGSSMTAHNRYHWVVGFWVKIVRFV